MKDTKTYPLSAIQEAAPSHKLSDKCTCGDTLDYKAVHHFDGTPCHVITDEDCKALINGAIEIGRKLREAAPSQEPLRWGQPSDVCKTVPVQEPCDMGDLCLGCSPSNEDGSCPDKAAPSQEPVAMEQIKQWAEAYPIDIFPELTKEEWKKARWALDGCSVTLDRISASNMRHVITRVKELLDTHHSDAAAQIAALRNEVEMGKRMCGQLMSELGVMNEALHNRKKQIAKLEAEVSAWREINKKAEVTVKKCDEQIAKLEAKLAAAEKDAARYRWLRANLNQLDYDDHGCGPIFDLSAANIDRAMKVMPLDTAEGE